MQICWLSILFMHLLAVWLAHFKIQDLFSFDMCKLFTITYMLAIFGHIFFFLNQIRNEVNELMLWHGSLFSSLSLFFHFFFLINFIYFLFDIIFVWSSCSFLPLVLSYLMFWFNHMISLDYVCPHLAALIEELWKINQLPKFANRWKSDYDYIYISCMFVKFSR